MSEQPRKLSRNLRTGLVLAAVALLFFVAMFVRMAFFGS